MYQVEIPIPVTQKQNIKDLLARKLAISKADFTYFKILKKSLDARNKNRIVWIYRILFDTSVDISKQNLTDVVKVSSSNISTLHIAPVSNKKKVIVVGMGPGGIFCALSLALSGIRCIIVERGRPIEKRVMDVEQFLKTRLLNEESNIQFGEGGAGTFSDGKLTARTKHPYYQFVIDEFIKAGAPEEIAYLSKPHIGTDRLRRVIINLRKKLQDLGVETRFEERLDDLIIEEGVLKGIKTNKDVINADFVVIATGYSARETLRMLSGRGVVIEPKGFAMGYRLELPQSIINFAMYGKKHNLLPPAEFFFTKYFPEVNLSVYTFCMCPGGMIVPACSSRNHLVLNGMSYYKRDGIFGNAAIVVSYNPNLWHNEKLGGVLLQEKIEKQAFEYGGSSYDAPAATVIDFINKKIVHTQNLNTSFPFNVKPYPIWEFYNDMYLFFREALIEFDRKLKGIVSEEAVLIAPETRTSSPYRITRDENLMSVNVKKLFPCGEGAGYSGGIITSAIDGLKVAEKIKELG